MQLVEGVRLEIQSDLDEMRDGIGELGRSIQKLQSLHNIGTTTNELAELADAFSRVRHRGTRLHANVSEMMRNMLQLSTRRKKADTETEQNEIAELREVITGQLSNHDFPYSYATATWSPHVLWNISFHKREATKEILRNFFAGKGQIFDGWNPSGRINPMLDPLPDDYESYVAGE